MAAQRKKAKAKKKINSRAKGKRGELAWVAFLKRFGFDARRGQQYAGGTDSPDVISDLDDLFMWEVKAVERGDIHGWMKKALEDCTSYQRPVIAWKKNRKDWLVAMDAADFLTFVHAFAELQHTRLLDPAHPEKFGWKEIVEEEA